MAKKSTRKIFRVTWNANRGRYDVHDAARHNRGFASTKDHAIGIAIREAERDSSRDGTPTAVEDLQKNGKSKREWTSAWSYCVIN